MNFPAPPQKQKGSPGKPRSVWRKKVKHCKGCGAVITDLPKSIFVKRNFCSQSCGRKHRNYNISHVTTQTREAAGFMIAEFIKDNTDLEWIECAILAVGFMEDYQCAKKRYRSNEHS